MTQSHLNKVFLFLSCVCQRLLAAHPAVELLSDLEDWLKKMDAQLNQEKETVFKAKDAAQISETLQHYQVLVPLLTFKNACFSPFSECAPKITGFISPLPHLCCHPVMRMPSILNALVS